MKRGMAVVAASLLAGSLWAQEPAGETLKQSTPEGVTAEVEALKPERQVWREIEWNTCTLDALEKARNQKKPVIVWVFLGIPSDERC